MKKIILQLFAGIFICCTLLSSCTDDFIDVNTDPINTPRALPEQLLAPALVNTLTVNMLRNRNFNNELMQVTVSLSDGDASVFRYEFRNTWSDYLWNNWYVQLTNFKDLYKQSSDSLTLNKSYQGISLICQSWIYSMLTDTYGDVPYSQSNMAREGIIEPAFDRQKDIYLDIFKKLEEANTLLSSNTAISASSDPVYNGNVSNWRRFGNSLYLRLLLRVSGKAEVADQAIAKIKEIAETKTSSYPIISSNAQSAILRWTGVAPYTSPYISVRDQDFRGTSMASFFIDHVRDWGDPRLDLSTYGINNVNRWGIAQGSNGFSGVESGYTPGAGWTRMSYFYSRDQQATSLQTDGMTGIIMNYPEIQYILAEAAAKGWIAGSAQRYWENGMLNGITLWLPNWPIATAAGTAPATPPTIDSPEFRKYLADADITWDEGQSIDWKMEQIHLHKYYDGLFLVDMQQWFEYRRTGHPVLPKGPGLKNNGIMPARMAYPVYVQSANPTSYKLAVDAQGADRISTQVWWQKP